MLCSHGRIVIARETWFASIGSLDSTHGTLRSNVNRLGPAGLSWLLDADAWLRTLVCEGIGKRSLLQFLGLQCPVETYRLAAPSRVTAGELAALVDPLIEQFEEASHCAELRALLAAQRAEESVTRDMMQAYLGE